MTQAGPLRGARLRVFSSFLGVYTRTNRDPAAT